MNDEEVNFLFEDLDFTIYEKDYNFRILPKLEILNKINASKPQNYFKEYISNIFHKGSLPSINALLKEGYLKYFNDEERYVVLNKFKENISKIFQKGKTSSLNYILMWELLKIFNEEEKKPLFDKIDYENIKNLKFKDSFLLLGRLARRGSSMAKNIWREEIIKEINKKNQNNIIFIIEDGYLEFFTAKDVEGMFENFDFSTFKRIEKPVKMVYIFKKLADAGGFAQKEYFEIVNNFKKEEKKKRKKKT